MVELQPMYEKDLRGLALQEQIQKSVVGDKDAMLVVFHAFLLEKDEDGYWRNVDVHAHLIYFLRQMVAGEAEFMASFGVSEVQRVHMLSLEALATVD